MSSKNNMLRSIKRIKALAFLSLFLTYDHNFFNSYTEESKRVSNKEIFLKNKTRARKRTGRFLASHPIIEEIINKDEDLENIKWIDTALNPNQSSILLEIQSQIKQWKRKEEFVSLWNLEVISPYQTPGRKEKESYIRNNFLSFLDSSLHQKMKTAKKGSTLHTLHRVEKNLTPKAKVEVSESVKLKFKTELLQGKISVDIENPYVEFQTKVNSRGKINSQLRKDIKLLRSIASIDYFWKDEKWVAKFESQITDQIKTGISAERENVKSFRLDPQNAKFEIMFSRPF